MQLAGDELGSKQLEACLEGHLSAADAVKIFSRAILVAALKCHDGNIAATARSLKLNRTSLTEMLQRRGNLWKISSHGRYDRQRNVPIVPICPDCLSVSASSFCSACEDLSSVLAYSTDSLCKSKIDN